MKTYEVWMSGFMIQGMDSPARATLYGNTSAESFQEACDKLAKQKDDKLYDSNYRSVWGCKLYDNEADARKIFG